MFNAKRIDNIDQYQKWGKGDRLVFVSNEADGIISPEIELRTVGPCVARLHVMQRVEGKDPKEAQSYLIDCFEGSVALRFAIGAELAHVTLEPSGEVWVRNVQQFAVLDNPNPDETFTRMENMALEMDELGIALHRQDVLSRIANSRENVERDAYSRKLEQQLAETNKRVDELLKAHQKAAESAASEPGEATQVSA